MFERNSGFFSTTKLSQYVIHIVTHHSQRLIFLACDQSLSENDISRYFGDSAQNGSGYVLFYQAEALINAFESVEQPQSSPILSNSKSQNVQLSSSESDRSSSFTGRPLLIWRLCLLIPHPCHSFYLAPDHSSSAMARGSKDGLQESTSFSSASTQAKDHVLPKISSSFLDKVRRPSFKNMKLGHQSHSSG
jgi:hypothetical protein